MRTLVRARRLFSRKSGVAGRSRSGGPSVSIVCATTWWMPCRSLRATACRHATHEACGTLCDMPMCAWHGAGPPEQRCSGGRDPPPPARPPRPPALAESSEAVKAVTPLLFRPSSSDRCRREGDGRACVRECACGRVRARACVCVRYVSVHVHAGACNQAGAFTNMRARARAWRDLLHGVIEHRRVKRVHERVAGVARRPRFLRQSRTGPPIRPWALCLVCAAVRSYSGNTRCVRSSGGVRGGCGGRQWRSTSGGIVGRGGLCLVADTDGVHRFVVEPAHTAERVRSGWIGAREPTGRIKQSHPWLLGRRRRRRPTGITVRARPRLAAARTAHQSTGLSSA